MKAGRTPTYVLCVLSVLFLSTAQLCADTALLARSYFSFLLADQTIRQARALAGGSPAEAQAQIRAVAEQWRNGKIARIRSELDAAYGPRAQAEFRSFEEAWQQAEAADDLGYAARTATALGLERLPDGFGPLRQAILEEALADDVRESSRLLSEAETWLDVRSRVVSAPSFQMWLARDASGADSDLAFFKEPLDRLSYAEPAFEEDVAVAAVEEPLFDSYRSMRKEKRDRVVEEAQAGMRQVAEERRAAEEEYGRQKLAAAEKEAAAVKRHAEDLAEVEKEALVQRQNSWSARLKEVVKATVTAAGGAFLGDIGAEAGRRAADAVFQ